MATNRIRTTDPPDGQGVRCTCPLAVANRDLSASARRVCEAEQAEAFDQQIRDYVNVAGLVGVAITRQGETTGQDETTRRNGRIVLVDANNEPWPDDAAPLPAVVMRRLRQSRALQEALAAPLMVPADQPKCWFCPGPPSPDNEEIECVDCLVAFWRWRILQPPERWYPARWAHEWAGEERWWAGKGARP